MTRARVPIGANDIHYTKYTHFVLSEREGEKIILGCIHLQGQYSLSSPRLQRQVAEYYKRKFNKEPYFVVREGCLYARFNNLHEVEFRVKVLALKNLCGNHLK